MIRLKTHFFILLIFAITIGLIGPVFAQPNVDVARIQPYLLEISNTTPDKIVSVIIQRASGSSDLENTIGRLGGSITQELAIIDAFSAVIPASAALKIASEPGVRWVSLDAPMVMSSCRDCVDGSNLESTYPLTVNADQVWVESTLWQGVSVAVLDSGMNYPVDFYSIMGQNRILTSVSFQNGLNQSTFDTYGHGTHIAGIVAGNGRSSSGEYIGIAPQVNLINVKVCDDMENGLCTAQSIVDGLQWVLENKEQYNIRVVNISLNSSVPESYNTSPINAAVEILWFNGVVVVASSGNHGVTNLYAPANDPYAIVVGAIDEKGSADLSDDIVAGFSSYGLTVDGFAKPDLVAPGKNIVSLIGHLGFGLSADHPENIVDRNYFMMSGTSVAAPIVSGAAALLLQSEPHLTPDQVKYRLMAAANKDWRGYSPEQAGAGTLDISTALRRRTTESANQEIIPHQLLAKMAIIAFWSSQNGDENINWENIDWTSVNWSSVNWNSTEWDN